HVGHPDCGHLVAPLPRDGSLVHVSAGNRGEYWGDFRRLPKARRKTLLLLLTPVLPQLCHGMRWQRDRAAPMARLGGLDPDAICGRLFERLLDRQPAGLKINAPPG